MLGFLTNLRDVKSSLSSGMLLLFGLWLWFGHQISNVHGGDTLLGNIARLVAYVGPVPTIAAITFCAYVLGVVLALDARVLNAIYKMALATPDFVDSEGRLRQHVEDLATRASLVRSPRELRNEIAPDGAPTPIRQSIWEELWAEGDADGGKARAKELKALVNDVMRQMYSEIDGLAHQLGKTDEKAYDRFHKARGEAEFRAGLIIPLLFITGVCATRIYFEVSPQWWCLVVVGAGAVAAGILVERANTSASESREAVYLAINRGHVEVADLNYLTSEIEKGKTSREVFGDSSSNSAQEREGQI
jgi:hypothetical protein